MSIGDPPKPKKKKKYGSNARGRDRRSNRYRERRIEMDQSEHGLGCRRCFGGVKSAGVWGFSGLDWIDETG